MDDVRQEVHDLRRHRRTLKQCCAEDSRERQSRTVSTSSGLHEVYDCATIPDFFLFFRCTRRSRTKAMSESIILVWSAFPTLSSGSRASLASIVLFELEKLSKVSLLGRVVAKPEQASGLAKL